MEDIKRTPAYEGNGKYIFASYAHKDSSVVLPIINKLFSDKYRLWYDEGIAPGSEWPKNIETHLNRSDTVIAFVSKSSLFSINCENEVKNAVDNKKVIEFSIDNNHHALLKDKKSVSTYEELASVLSSELIGDGISGYGNQIKKSKGSLWNVLLGLSILLLILLGIGLYGLNKGWFDSYFPALREASQTNELITKDDSLDISSLDKTLQSAIYTNLGNEKYNEEIVFENEYDQKSLLNSINYYEWGENPLTYGDLLNNDLEEIYLEHLSDNLCELMPYFKNLRILYVYSVEENIDMSTLNNCGNLEMFVVNEDALPISIPEEVNFLIKVMN